MTATTPFEVAIRREGGRAVLDMQGEINSFAEAALNGAYTQATGAELRTIVLNFSEVTYINSTGVALIVGLLARARKEKLPVSVYGLTDHYLQIFQITRLSDFMTIYDDEASALVDGSASAADKN